MRRWAFALMLGLAACGRGEPEAVPTPAPSFREAGTMIASTTRGGPEDLSGEWVVAESYPKAPFGVQPGSWVVMTNTPDGGSWAVMPPNRVGFVTFLVRETGPGRFVEVSTGGEFWVLWVDDDFRTAVVGTPDGTFGWIMNRPNEASEDRTRAAREMLDFNGYDLGRLTGG